MWDPLRAWRQAWANITAQHGSDTVADIIVCGDSITQGYFATDAENRWVDRLSAKLSEAAGHAAPTGYISANSLYCSYGSKKWTVTAGSVTDRQDLGLAYAAATLTSGSTIEYECDCDRIWVFYPTYSVLVGSIAISIDGGAPTVIAQFKPGTATRGGNVWDSGALASGSHTIEISQSGGFSGVVEGAYFFNGNHDRGVRVWQGGHFGYQASHYASRGVSSWWTDGFGAINPVLVLVPLQTNDQVAGVAVSDYYDSMVEVAQRSLLASPSDAKAPSLGMVAALSIGNDPHSSEPYRQATAWASRDTSLVKYAHEAAFLDLAAVGGFVGTGGDPFQITFDGKHPNDKGHELIANYVFGVLTAGYGYPNVNAFASQGDADAWGFPHTALGDEVKSSSVFPIANAALFLRSRGGGTISQVGLRVRASAGSISVATLIGPGGPNPPTTRTQTSGPISCPAIGFAQIALAGTATLSSTTGWFAVSGDGSAFNVASFDTAGGSASPAQDNAGAGSAYLGSTSHPVPPSPTGLVPCTYARYILIGG